MNKETFINSNKTIINTEYYLKLLSDEDNLNKLIKYLEDKIKEKYIGGADICGPCRFATRNETYQEILEKVKSGKYE